jgi:hypothetical protein
MLRFDTSIVSTCGAVALMVFACGGEDPSGGDLAGGSGAGDSTTASSSSSTTGPMASTGVGQMMTTTGMGTFECDPAAAAGSLYALDDAPHYNANQSVSMCQYRGDVLLIFNAAAL